MSTDKLLRTNLPISNRNSPRRGQVQDGYVLQYDAITKQYVPIDPTSLPSGNPEQNDTAQGFALVENIEGTVVGATNIFTNTTDKHLYITTLSFYTILANIVGSKTGDISISLGTNVSDYNDIIAVATPGANVYYNLLLGQTDTLITLAPGATLTVKVNTAESGATEYPFTILMQGFYSTI